MNPIILIGSALAILGIVALSYHGIAYKTHEKVLKIGPIEATEETEKTIALPSVLGGTALAAGIVLIVMGAKR